MTVTAYARIHVQDLEQKIVIHASSMQVETLLGNVNALLAGEDGNAKDGVGFVTTLVFLVSDLR